MDKTELIKLLINHVDEIVAIQYNRNYAKAEELYQRTKTIASKYFQREYYSMELIGVRFKPVAEGAWTTESDYKAAWYDGIVKINSISKAMIDNLKLQPVQTVQVPNPLLIEQANKIKAYEKKVAELENRYSELENAYSQLRSQNLIRIDRIHRIKKYSLFLILLIISSTLLWSFNSYLHWEWLSKHPKRVPLYISFQLLILLSLLRIVTKNKVIKTLDWILAIFIGLLSIL